MDSDDAVLFEQGIPCLACSRKTSCMREDGAPGPGGPSQPKRHDRLAQLPGALQRLAESARLSNRFNHKRDHPDLGILDGPAEVIAHVQTGLVSRGDAQRKS